MASLSYLTSSGINNSFSKLFQLGLLTHRTCVIKSGAPNLSQNIWESQLTKFQWMKPVRQLVIARFGEGNPLTEGTPNLESSHPTPPQVKKAVQLLDTDLTESFVKGGGKGGQKVNKVCGHILRFIVSL
jgi:hypothetical protein